jgi:hypothetical protein
MAKNYTKMLLDLLFLWPKFYQNTLGPPSYLTQPQGGFAKGTQVMTNLGVVAWTTTRDLPLPRVHKLEITRSLLYGMYCCIFELTLLTIINLLFLSLDK